MIGTRSCRDVITRLLDKDELKRLGSKSGASEVKQHKWFAKINWGLLRNTQPPVSELLPSWLFPVIFFDVNFTATFAGSCYSKSHACDPNRLSEDCSHCLRVLRTQRVWMTFAVWCMYSLHWISIMGNDFYHFLCGIWSISQWRTTAWLCQLFVHYDCYHPVMGCEETFGLEPVEEMRQT